MLSKTLTVQLPRNFVKAMVAAYQDGDYADLPDHVINSVYDVADALEKALDADKMHREAIAGECLPE